MMPKNNSNVSGSERKLGCVRDLGTDTSLRLIETLPLPCLGQSKEGDKKGDVLNGTDSLVTDTDSMLGMASNFY
jgi:hypothetical protein